MGKERLVAFIDAVIAIIMTILVLKLEKPRTFDLQGLWELRTNFFAYGLFFFWLGAMWTNFHSSSQVVEKISQKTVWTAIIMLFFSSFFPYTTKLVASNFNNATMQVFYGVIVLLISFSVLWYYHTLVEVNQTAEIEQLNISRLHWMKWDIAIKILGIILSLTIFPAAEIVSVLITLCALVIPNQFRL
ncbi:TMEM175 family protein [Streptococcus anginosus]|uniref:TMEM175 family protein n=1 Tax=Streptococcus anginosus TaxID=1328 RepID=UPI001485B8CF|nr:TMEM175 family protein [Streptococcus anginosus]MCW1035528.1 TMEM175 family protein [Streptococcus anginosus]